MDKCLFISKSALEYNVDYYISKCKKEFIAVVKNNAYGNGMKEVISILENKKIKMYAVSNLKEAKELSNYTKRDILILDKLDDYTNLDNNFVITIVSLKHLKQLIELNISLRVHLKINIAMKRKGVEVDEVDNCLSLIKNSKLKLEGIYSHYSSYKLKDLKQEFSVFKSVIDKIESKDLIIHASSSISALNLEESATNAIRVGVGMYGVKKLDKVMEPLKIVSELKCSCINSYPIKCFARFGYHNLYIGKKGYIVMTNLGYGDGLFYKNKIKGYLENTYIKEIGVRNMDNMFFYSKYYVLENSVIEIYGKHNKIDDLAKRSHIAVCRLLALLNANIKKEIVD